MTAPPPANEWADNSECTDAPWSISGYSFTALVEWRRSVWYHSKQVKRWIWILSFETWRDMSCVMENHTESTEIVRSANSGHVHFVTWFCTPMWPDFVGTYTKTLPWRYGFGEVRAKSLCRPGLNGTQRELNAHKWRKPKLPSNIRHDITMTIIRLLLRY